MIGKVKNNRIRNIFLLAAFFVIVLSITSYIRIINLVDQSKLVNHTNIVKLKLENTLSMLYAMESTNRGYMLTFDSSFFLPLPEVSAQIQMEIGRIDSLTKDNPSQQQHLIVLRKLVDTKFELLQRNLGMLDPSLITVQNRLKGKKIMDDLSNQIDAMQREEDNILKNHTASFGKSAFLAPRFMIVLILGSILILILSYLKIQSELNKSEKLMSIVQKRERQIKKSEEKFLKIFNLSPIPMLLTEIKTDKITYANRQFYDAFGYTEEEVIGHTSEELKLTGDEETQRITGILLDLLQESRSLEELQALSVEETEELLIKLRQKEEMKNLEILYTRKNGENFLATVSFEIIGFGPQRFTLTSYYDITDRKKFEQEIVRKNRELQQKNAELQSINKELESFTFISSHDLQEPLRKIQNFASLILEDKQQPLSDKGKFYFERINVAAKRMQILIRDLLTYSRTTSSDRKFIDIHLSQIVLEVIDEFWEEIKEKNAIVEIGDMCEVKVIHFQFHQLIHNIIGNSLKFSNQHIPPIINVNGTIKNGLELNNPNLLPDKAYCHICISDNGIGFEPQYQDRIFEVFQRLHDKEKIPGTGIGLAIVKKIVDNHRGFITATGQLNKGATFDIYIPA
jgi:signal transduction histidine kinase/CHASE3 domain sensor protein